MKSADDSLPLMHTHYLSASQLAYCERNPTYTANLTRVKKIQQRVFELQSQLGASRNNPDLDNRALARWRDKINNTEELFMADDDELASLAEALLAKDKFKIEDEVYMIDGRWCWSLPKGPHIIPRHCSGATLHPGGSQSEPPSRSLSRRVSKRLSDLLPRRTLSGAQKLKKTRSAEKLDRRPSILE